MGALKGIVVKWSPAFAYAIGLITTDGNLSPDGRHISFTSKDEKLVLLLKKCFNLSNKITKKGNGANSRKRYFLIQFGSVSFYRFLESIGLIPAKSKCINSLLIPNKYFFDFLRGHLDGDGTFYSYWDPRWKSSFMYYTTFTSASKNHIEWLRYMLSVRLGIKGHISKARTNSAYQLKYAKAESLKLLPKLYYDKQVICLRRKKVKIAKALRVEGNIMRGW